MQDTTIINAVRSFVNDYTSVFKSGLRMDKLHRKNDSESDFEQVLTKTEKLLEAQMMLEAGVPLSVIAKTLDLRISEILGHQ